MMLKLHDLSKKYADQVVLDKLNLQLPEKGIIGLAGSSGCGKTTLLHILAGLIQPDSGTVDGLKGKKVSLVFQEDRLLPWLTAAGNLNLVIQDMKKTNEWLQVMGLSEQAGKIPDELSGGMKRRLALARGLAFGGDIILLDEPFKGMDQKLKRKIYPAVQQAKDQALLLLVSHDPGEIHQLCSQVMLASGPPLQLQEVSAEEYALQLAED